MQWGGKYVLWGGALMLLWLVTAVRAGKRPQHSWRENNRVSQQYDGWDEMLGI